MAPPPDVAMAGADIRPVRRLGSPVASPEAGKSGTFWCQSSGCRQNAWMDVTVAPVSAEDCDAFVAAVCASHDLHHPWINPADSAERFEEWLERLGRDDQEAYLIRHESCGDLVGYVSVSNIVRRAFQSAQLGYAAFTSHVGRGLMALGLGAVIDHAFREMGLHRL